MSKQEFDFPKYYEEQVQSDVKYMKEHGNTGAYQNLHCIDKNGEVQVYGLVIEKSSRSPLEYAAAIVKTTKPEYYMTVAAAWAVIQGSKGDQDRKQTGYIQDIAPEDRQEFLIFIGKNYASPKHFDKRMFFEIKRERHGDEDSKVLDIKEWNPDSSVLNHLP